MRGSVLIMSCNAVLFAAAAISFAIMGVRGAGTIAALVATMAALLSGYGAFKESKKPHA